MCDGSWCCMWLCSCRMLAVVFVCVFQQVISICLLVWFCVIIVYWVMVGCCVSCDFILFSLMWCLWILICVLIWFMQFRCLFVRVCVRLLLWQRCVLGLVLNGLGRQCLVVVLVWLVQLCVMFVFLMWILLIIFIGIVLLWLFSRQIWVFVVGVLMFICGFLVFRFLIVYYMVVLVGLYLLNSVVVGSSVW